MEKTKFGVSVSVVSTVLFLLALVDSVPALLFVGYIFLFEDNHDLKKAASNLVGIIVIFGLFFGVLSILE